MRTPRIIGAVAAADRTIPPRGGANLRVPELRTGYTAPLPFSQTIAGAIAEASAIERGKGPEGTKPLLGRHERRRLGELFRGPVAPWLERLLEGAHGGAARGLLLRATHARIDRLSSARRELEAFARTLATLADREMLRRGTVLDLDSTTNTSALDPLIISERRGWIRAPKDTNDDADNDGLFQRWTASCGPTVVQMMICNADPISSFAVHRIGLTSDSSDDEVADFQRRLLEESGGIAIGRREAQLRARVRNGAGRLRTMGAIDDRERTELLRAIEKGAPITAPAERALAAMRERFGGPTEAELARLRAAKMPATDAGIGIDELLAALGKYVTPLTGVRYEGVGSFARGQCWRHLDRAERALRDGIDVPFGIEQPGHWMLMTDVKGRAPHRRFLVSDPEGGRTAWVKEKDLRDGTFVDRQFHLCIDDQRGYIDCFLLPARSGT